MRDAADDHLRQACRLTGAAWAALAGTKADHLEVVSAHGLNASRVAQVEKWLNSESGSAWHRALNGGGRSLGRIQFNRRSAPDEVRGFRTGDGQTLLVCDSGQGPDQRRLWEFAAGLIRTGVRNPREEATRNVQGASAYDARQGLAALLARFLRAEGEAAILAIRRGEQLVVAAEHASGLERGLAFGLEDGPLLRRLHRTRSSVLARRGSGDWSEIPFRVQAWASSWSAFPLVVEDRLIGTVALWSRAKLSETRCRSAAKLARQISPNVDVIISLGEVTTQLQRLATLNEFALTISSAEGVPQLAQRVLEHLASLYPAYEISLYVPTLDGQHMQEFHVVDSLFREDVTDVVDSPVASWFEISGEDWPQSSLSNGGQGEDGRLQDVFPLRYRAASVGALALRGPAGVELPRYDRSLLAAVASYMAGVVDHGRLRAEAIDRAQSLEETVHQLRQAEQEAGARLRAQQTAESRLVQAAKLAAVGEMAAGVAHELNNPLTTVSGFAELLLEETPADAPYRADLEMVLHEAHRARSVVRRLLDFARQGETARARADINEVVRGVLALMTHFIHTSGVQLELDLGSELPWMTVDANQMKQVLLNLLHNALHAMPGGGRLQVRTRMRPRDARDWIVVDVCDNGVGMEPAEIGRIFDPFYTTRGESGGTGLGLSVTYGIITDHGGTIEVQSQRGSGSTFSVWLPV